MTDLARLTVRLEADNARLQRDLDKAQAQINRYKQRASDAFTDAAKRIGTGLGLAAVAAATSVAALVKNSIDAADELNKLSQKVGIATDDLSKLQYAAKLADVDTAALQTSLVKLSKSAVDAADGTGDSAAAFRALGVNVKDANGQIKSSYDLLLETADAFSQFEDGPEKAAAAVAIFGKAGADIIPLLNGGRKAIEDAGDELERFGGVVAPEAARQAEAFNDNLTRLQTVAHGAANQLAADLLPALVDVTDAFVELRQNDELKQFGRGSVIVLATVAESLVAVGKAARAIGGSFEAVFADIKLAAQFVGRGGFAGLVLKSNREELAKALDERNATVEEANKRYVELWNYNGTFISDAIKRSFEQADTALAGYTPDLSNVPTLDDLFGGGKQKLGFADQKQKEKQATEEAAEAQRRLNAENEQYLSLAQNIAAEDKERFDIQSRQDDIGLDAAENIENEIKRIEGIGPVLDDLNNKQLQFANNFGGAFAAYSEEIKNVSATIGGDLVSALDSAIYRTADLAANTLLWGEGGEEALKALGRSIITDVVSSLIKVGLQMAANAALQATLGTSMAAATTAFAGAATAAWTPAAIGASIATLGGAGPIGLGAYLTALAAGETAALASSAAGGGFADGGFTGTMGRDQVAGLVHGQEYVLNADAVSRIGIANLDAMNEGRFSMPSAGQKAMASGSSQVNIVAQPGTVVVKREEDGALIARIADPLANFLEAKLANQATAGVGPLINATARKLGAQQTSVRR